MITLNGKNNFLDLTRFVPVPDYKVNEIDNFVEWTDGNYNKHRHITDSKAEGVFTLKFHSINEYFNFVNFYEENKEADGAIKAVVFCMNKNRYKSIYAFIDYDPQNTLPLMSKKEFDGFEVTISERGF